jgi:predicted peptidase
MKSKVARAVCLGAVMLAIQATPGTAQTPGSQQANSLDKTITKKVTARYLLYLPKEYGKDAATRWPLILFLHGAGESGDDLEKVKKHGPPRLISEGKEFPFVVVSPQSPGGGWSAETLGVLLDEVIEKYAVDKDRIYLTGLSMGGYGTWDTALAFPDRFAAIAPICGGGTSRRVRRIRHVPAWIFHGAKDEAVPLKEGQDMADALKAAGGNVKFTVYPEAGHDSWTETYNNPELYTWFLQHKRQTPAARQ